MRAGLITSILPCKVNKVSVRLHTCRGDYMSAGFITSTLQLQCKVNKVSVRRRLYECSSIIEVIK